MPQSIDILSSLPILIVGLIFIQLYLLPINWRKQTYIGVDQVLQKYYFQNSGPQPTLSSV